MTRLTFGLSWTDRQFLFPDEWKMRIQSHPGNVTPEYSPLQEVTGKSDSGGNGYLEILCLNLIELPENLTIQANSTESANELAIEQYTNYNGTGSWEVYVEYLGDGLNLDAVGGMIELSYEWMEYELAEVNLQSSP